MCGNQRHGEGKIELERRVADHSPRRLYQARWIVFRHLVFFFYIRVTLTISTVFALAESWIGVQLFVARPRVI